MPGWPSKDPDDYAAAPLLNLSMSRWLEAQAEELPEPPLKLLLPTSFVGALLIAAAAVGTAGPMDTFALLWILAGGMWLSRMQLTRWWRWRQPGPPLTWVPASVFAWCAALGGFVAVASGIAGEREEFAIYLGLLVAWSGGDALDWVWRRWLRPATGVAATG